MNKTFTLAIIATLISSNIYARSNTSASNRSSSSARSRSSSLVSASSVSTTATTTADVSTEKTEEICQTIFSDCMDKKLTQDLMKNDLLYSDYTDMVTDVYGGMSQPQFKCFYDTDVNGLYSDYNYGISNISVGSSAKKIKDKSIAFYEFLSQNAADVASKKIPAAFLHDDIIDIAAIEEAPLESQKVDLPEASYVIASHDAKNLYKQAGNSCFNIEENTDFSGCEEFYKKEKDLDELKDIWEDKSLSMKKSCEDYKIFLTDKLTESKQDAESFIKGLRIKLVSTVEEYNLNIEAEEALKALGL